MLKDRDKLKDKDVARMAAEADRPLPPNLKSRLKAIPQEVVTCRDSDRLYRAARHRAAGDRPDPSLAEHLADCAPCRALFDTLHGAFSEPPEPPPARLTARLHQIARRPRQLLPAWILEPRLATAACILMTVVLSSVATDATALFRDAGGAVSAKATTWAEAGETRSRKMWQTAATASSTSYASGREQLAGFAESCQTFFQQTVRTFGSLARQPENTPDGGQPDGKPDTESE